MRRVERFVNELSTRMNEGCPQGQRAYARNVLMAGARRNEPGAPGKQTKEIQMVTLEQQLSEVGNKDNVVQHAEFVRNAGVL